MISFQHIVNTLLEAEERQGGISGGKYFGAPKGFGKSSAIQGVGLYNRDQDSRYEFDPEKAATQFGSKIEGEAEGEYSQQTQQQAQREMMQMQAAYYKKLSGVFSVVNKDPETKSHAESIIEPYMSRFNRAQALRQQISRNINKSETTKDGDLSHLGTSIEESARLVEQLERMEDIIYHKFVSYVVDVVAPYLANDEAKRVQTSGDDSTQPRPLEYFQKTITELFEKWKTKKDEAYQEQKSKSISNVQNGRYFGFSTAVSSLASWLNNTAARLGYEQQRAAENIVKYNSSKSVTGKILHIPEGQKVKRLLDVVDEARHMFATAADSTSKFVKAGAVSSVDKLKTTEKFIDLHNEANQIVSDLSGLLGSGQFELFKLVTAFFDDEEGAEANLRRFILRDVVEAFNA